MRFKEEQKFDLLSLNFDAVIYISRLDKIAQAYSYTKASITDQWRHDIHPRENLDVQNIKDSQILYKMHQLRLFEEFYNTHLKQKVSQNYVYEDFTSQKDFFVSVFKDLKIDISDNYKFNPTLTKQQNESDLARIRLFKKNLNLEV